MIIAQLEQKKILTKYIYQMMKEYYLTGHQATKYTLEMGLILQNQNM